MNKIQNHNKEEGVPFFPNHILREAMVAFGMIGVLLILATFIPAPMDEPADPFSTPEHIKPEWYFLAAYQILKAAEKLSFLGPWAPKIFGILGQGVIMGILFLLPFIDRSPERSLEKRKLVIRIGIIGVIGFVLLTIWGLIS
jgi:quinol-cytochrome oxidoreductase complex cytochrome b subunit